MHVQSPPPPPVLSPLPRPPANRALENPMPDAYLGEIRIFAAPYVPLGWVACNGQLLQIDENPQLFALLGTTYGGDGTTTFAVPDLQGRVPIHVGNGHALGEA